MSPRYVPARPSATTRSGSSGPSKALTLTHEVVSLDAAAAGAVGVADWAAVAPPGAYTVHEVFDAMVAAMAESAHEPVGRPL